MAIDFETTPSQRLWITGPFTLGALEKALEILKHQGRVLIIADQVDSLSSILLDKLKEMECLPSLKPNSAG
jgi:hypothetical protein